MFRPALPSRCALKIFPAGLVLAWVWAGLGAGGLRAENTRILEIENIVQTSTGGDRRWQGAVKDQSLAVQDRVRTRQRSRATVRLSGLYTLRMNQFTTIQITPQLVGKQKPRLDMAAGKAFIFSREPDSEIDITTPAANAALRGTQLVVEVSENGHTLIQVIEGAVEMHNAHGRLALRAGEAGEANVGEAPKRTAVIEARNILQWALYYPAVIDPGEIPLGAADRKRVGASLAAYRAGDLLGALEKYPDHAPASTGGRLYKAGVLLAVGRVDEARALVARIPEGEPGRAALERMIAAVLLEAHDQPTGQSGTVAGAIAESYFQQSLGNLEAARAAASHGTGLRPENGYAWTRLAELEFSFGRLDEALLALAQGLELTPRNARTHALQGFVLSGQNRIAEAQVSFQNAIDLDGALASGWLGRGLTRIRTGDMQGGLEDLQTAATVEPTMSIYHSYLAKAFSDAGLALEASRDIDLAKRLDPDDPTPWLYSALDLQKSNRTNEAIGELHKSVELNDNRRIYRSRFLLDQDLAVRSANLAKIYQDAGMFDVAVREATRAVESDYTNPSAHLFLANSFDALRDPRRIELRYETPWFNELLLANLLSPVGGGALSQYVSQQEYSKLFEQDGIGGHLSTEYRSTSEIRSALSVFGHAGNVDFGIDASYGDDDGDRFNSDSRLKELYAQFKWQVTPNDVFYFLGKWGKHDSGDNFRTYSHEPLSPHLDFTERQDPGLLLAGWNHQWEPGVNTLFLGGRLAADQTLTDPMSNQLLIQRSTRGMRPDFIRRGVTGFDEFTDPALRFADPPAVRVDPADGESLIYSDDLLREIDPYLGTGNVLWTTTAPFNFKSQREFEIYTAELQHIVQCDTNTFLAGARWQDGEIKTDTDLSINRPTELGRFSTSAYSERTKSDFERTNLYVYDYWQVHPTLTLIGGASWDRVEHPDNFRNPPVNDEQREEEQFSLKGAFTWVPTRAVTFRGAYTEGLGGVSFDESVRLEPVQIAGFNQSFRTIISESIAGSVETPEFRTWGLSAEGRLGRRTWWGAGFQSIEQDVDRSLGVFTGYRSSVFVDASYPAYFADNIAQRLEYQEDRFSFTLNHLLGDQVALGARYRYTKSDLRSKFPEFAGDASVPGLLEAERHDEASLHEVSLYSIWNSPSGWYAQVEANWFKQDLEDDPRSGDEFTQFNAYAGYHFKQRRGDISVGLLNIGDQDYRLSPLNPYPEIARDRTFVLRYRVSF